MGKKRLVNYLCGSKKTKKENNDDKLPEHCRDDGEPVPQAAQSTFQTQISRVCVPPSEYQSDRGAPEKGNDEVSQTEKREVKQSSGERNSKVQERIRFFDGGVDLQSPDSSIRVSSAGLSRGSSGISSPASTGQHLTSTKSCPNLRLNSILMPISPQTLIRHENTNKGSGCGKVELAAVMPRMNVLHNRDQTRICLILPSTSRTLKPRLESQDGSNHNQLKSKVGERIVLPYITEQKDIGREKRLSLEKDLVAVGSARIQIEKHAGLEAHPPTRQASAVELVGESGTERNQAKDQPVTEQRKDSKIRERIRRFSSRSVIAGSTQPIPASASVRKHGHILADETTPSPKTQLPPTSQISKPESKEDCKTQSKFQSRMRRISDRIKLFEGFTTVHRGYSADVFQPLKEKTEKGTSNAKEATETRPLSRPLWSFLPLSKKVDAGKDTKAGRRGGNDSSQESPLKTANGVLVDIEKKIAMPTLAGDLDLEAILNAASGDVATRAATRTTTGTQKGGSLDKDALSSRSRQERLQRRDRRSRSRSRGRAAPGGCDGAVDRRAATSSEATVIAKTGDAARGAERAGEGRERSVAAANVEMEVGSDLAPLTVPKLRSGASGGERGGPDLHGGRRREAVLIDTVVAQCELSQPRPRRLTEAVRMVKLCRGWSTGDCKGGREKSGSWGKRADMVSAIAGAGGEKEAAPLR